jgi:hypothetical protein
MAVKLLFVEAVEEDVKKLAVLFRMAVFFYK